MHYLITGGCGYIGSHIATLLHGQGHDVTIFDNLSNSSPEALQSLQSLCENKISFQQIDLKDIDSLRRGFKQSERFDGVFHLAGIKELSNDDASAQLYFENNVQTTRNLCDIMFEFRVFKLVYGSSSTVYGAPEKLPLNELCSTKPVSPYGNSIMRAEADLFKRAFEHPEWRIAALRCFNTIGSHPDGSIGDAPAIARDSLVNTLFEVLQGKLDYAPVWGNDYHTHDGTSIRDYVHVMDVAEASLLALKYLEQNKGFETFNIGTGRGYSVMDMLFEAQEVTGHPVPFTLKPRREHDHSEILADTRKSSALLGWKATRGLDAMLKDHWKYAVHTTLEKAPA